MVDRQDAFYILRLNRNTENGWAVIVARTHAIAKSPTGELIFRLTEDEAKALAKSMNEAAHGAISVQDPDRT